MLELEWCANEYIGRGQGGNWKIGAMQDFDHIGNYLTDNGSQFSYSQRRELQMGKERKTKINLWNWIGRLPYKFLVFCIWMDG